VNLTIRRGQAKDIPECGRICYAAFTAIANAHHFKPDLPDVAVAVHIVGMMLAHPDFYGVVAEQDGKILGSNFLDERNSISGVGPITIDPELQNSGIGGRLMRAVMQRSAARGFPGIRLVQAGYHVRSLSLYLKLGFNVREHLCCVQGPAIHAAIDGYAVRPAKDTAGGADLAACNALCERVHGHSRAGEVRDAIAGGGARVVERGGRITGYTTGIAFFGHTVCETNDDLKALISAATSIDGAGFLAPSCNGELLRWCFAQGLRVTQTMTLMSMGLYNEPAGAYLCSVTY
jgi:GNAT superfamily N-acetyltransferase